MQKFNLGFKNNLNTAKAYNIEADSEAAAMLEAAQLFGMDTDPFTQTYSLILEVIPSKTQPMKGTQ